MSDGLDPLMTVSTAVRTSFKSVTVTVTEVALALITLARLDFNALATAAANVGSRVIPDGLGW
jgi:hypothetical protein